MVSKVNGIKIYPKRSLGTVLSGSVCVFTGFIILLLLTLFPIIGATINGTIMQANAVDYASDVFSSGDLKAINFLDSFSKGTHFFASSKYNSDLFTYLTSFKTAGNIENAAVSWYAGGFVYLVFDYIMAFGYIILFVLAAFMLVEGIIRLATGTYPKTSRILTVVSFFVLTLFVISSFITNFCTKYIAKEVMGEGETYVVKVCPLQYILWIILLLCWVGQYWINVLFIKGKLYVADARLIKKRNKDKEEKVEMKKTRKRKEAPVLAEEAVEDAAPVEEVPVAEETQVNEEIPVNEETPTLVETTKNVLAHEDVKEENPVEQPVEENVQPENVEEEKKSAE